MQTVEELREHARKIGGAVDDILGEMAPDVSLGAVNWADLMCVEVGVSLTGDELEWTATVEEASPDSAEFAVLIAGKLADRGFPNVCIRTEW